MIPEFLEGLTVSGLTAIYEENIHGENLCSFTLNRESFPVNFLCMTLLISNVSVPKCYSERFTVNSYFLFKM